MTLQINKGSIYLAYSNSSNLRLNSKQKIQRAQYILLNPASILMQPGTRKFYTNERSVPKQSRPSYQTIASTDKDISNVYYAQYGVRKELTKNSSDANLQHPKEEYFKNLNNRRKNEGQMSNLKSELQNLKNQVNKLISKESALRTPQKQRIPIREQRSDKKVNYVTRGFNDDYTDREEDFSDTASMTSVTTQKVLNQPLRRLQKKVVSQNYDQSYYMQLENDLLKTEIKNLKNKYVSKKRQLTEKCELLQKKNEFLEISLQKSEESLIQCRKALETEIMMIKRQITMKTEIKNETHLPESDRPELQGQGNQLLQEKLKKLYDQMNEKNKLINNLSIEVGDLDSSLERKKFELKKQMEKSLELGKQLQLAKRQSSRLQVLVETEISKKKDLVRENQQLKQKNKELMEENYKKEQIVTGSEQYENRMAEELEQYKRKEDELETKLSQLREENKKLKQLVSTNNDEIASLKRSSDDTIARIAQLSRRLKEQQEKAFQREDHYRRLLQQTKQKQEQKINILKQHYEHQAMQRVQEQTIMVKQHSHDTSQALREKQRQINRWKAQYKILKLKHQEKHSSQTLKKEQSQQYYKGFIQFKHKAQLLEDRNRLLEHSCQQYLNKLTEYEAEKMRLDVEHSRTINALRQHVKSLQREVESLQEELNLTKSQLTETTQKADEEGKYRQDLENKLQIFIQKQLHGQSSEEEEQVFEQPCGSFENMESPQKQPKRTFLQDDEQSPIQQQNKRKPKKSKTQQPYNLTQSQKLQLEQLSEAITSIKKRVIQQDQKLAKSIRQLKNKDAQITKLKKEIRELLETHEKQLEEIKEKFTMDKVEINVKKTIDTQKEVRDLCEKEIELHQEKYGHVLRQNVEMKAKIEQIEKELLDLRQETKSLSHLYNVKCEEVEEIAEKNAFELQQREKKLDELFMAKNQRQNILLNQISHLKDEITSLRLEIKNLLSTTTHKLEFNNFDQALRNQIETTKTLREELAKKNEEVYKVRDNYTLLRSQYDNLRSEGEIQKLKNISEKKNLQIQYQIEVQNMKNRLSVEEKKIASLQQKITLVIEENKKKDSFIQTYIMGKKLPQSDKQFVTEFVKQYEITLAGKAINEKLRADSQQLQKMAAYNYRLLKDMAEMKEKMLLYETMEGEVLSLYDSRQSGEINRENDFDSPHKSSSRQGSNTNSPSRKFKKMSSLIDFQNDN